MKGMAGMHHLIVILGLFRKSTLLASTERMAFKKIRVSLNSQTRFNPLLVVSL